MRLVEWNVAMCLQTKAHLLHTLNPTVAVLPESARPAKTRSALEAIGATSVKWDGANDNKGLSVVGFHGWNVRIDESYDREYQWVLPVHLTGPAHIRLLAVWDMNHRGRGGHESARQLGACRASLNHYEDFLSGESDLVVISGDFNNSVYWDTPTKQAKFGDFMDQLESRGFVSAYHYRNRCGRGAEPDPTLWWTRNVNRPYHIDYTFVSRPEAIQAVEVGAHEDWLAYSDHSPMTVDLCVVPRNVTPRYTPSTCDTVSGAHDYQMDPPLTPPIGEQRRRRTGSIHFNLEPGCVPDMKCGVNGVPFVQTFRPTYFTAEWSDGVLVEVRVWGPRVLHDESLGKRELDHRWKRPRAAGGIDYAELPAAVADRLRG